MNHPVLELLHCLPRAIWQTAPLLRQGKSMAVLELDLRGAADDETNDARQPSRLRAPDEERPPPPPPPPLAPLAANAAAPAHDGGRPRPRRRVSAAPDSPTRRG